MEIIKWPTFDEWWAEVVRPFVEHQSLLVASVVIIALLVGCTFGSWFGLADDE